MSIGLFMPALLINPEIRVVLPNGHLPVDRMDLFFTPEEWASTTAKRIIVEAGTEVGNNAYGYALAVTDGSAGQAGSFNGRLILENNGIMSGRGGVANGGVGGDVINANFPGRNGQKLEIINRGTLRAGGGGGGAGGKGGTGGGGSYNTTVREPTTGERHSADYGIYYWDDGNNRYGYRYYWPGTSSFEVGTSSGPWTRPDGWTYYRGSRHQGSSTSYAVYRSRVNTTNTNGGAGGNGGGGGLGQGFGQARSNGVVGTAGANGGTNAGRGGTGGTGGNGGGWGASGTSGNTGATGAAGNRTGGSAGAGGSAGGLAGFYVNGNANVIWEVTGTRQGRVI